MEDADPHDVHSSSGEVFAHVGVVVVLKVSRSILLFDLLLARTLAKTNLTKHVGERQVVLVRWSFHGGARDLVDVRTNIVATYHDC